MQAAWATHVQLQTLIGYKTSCTISWLLHPDMQALLHGWPLKVGNKVD
jgi:hypothetical protein